MTPSKSEFGVNHSISITTYNDPTEYSKTLAGPLLETADVMKVNSVGNQVRYNPSLLTHALVFIAGGEKLVEIRYATPQSQSALLATSEYLQLVV